MEAAGSQTSQAVVDIIAKRRDERLRRPTLYQRLLAELLGTFLLVFAVGISAAGGESSRVPVDGDAARVAEGKSGSDIGGAGRACEAIYQHVAGVAPAGDVLIFLPGRSQMVECSQLVNQQLKAQPIEEPNGVPTGPVAVGLILAVLVYAFGPVSGGFLNPAVVLAVLISGRGKLALPHAVLYVAVQLLGAVVAGFCAFAVTGTAFVFDYAQTRGLATSLGFEVFFTAALCMAVLTVATSNDAPNQYFGFAIGIAVSGGALACGGLHQACFNPAVALGMNLAGYANDDATPSPSGGAWALFLLAPLLGALLAAVIFCTTRRNEYDAPEMSEPAPAQVPDGGVGQIGWSIVDVINWRPERQSSRSA